MSYTQPIGLGLTEAEYSDGRAWAFEHARQHGFPEGPEGTNGGRWLEHTVRWSEMDPMRHVNNAKYGTYMEYGRVNLIDAIRAHILDPEAKRKTMVIAKLNITFVAPALAPDVILVCHRISAASERSFELESLLLSFRQKRVVAKGTAQMRGFDLKQQKASQFDAHWINALGPYTRSQPPAQAKL